ncbi:MAG: RNA polymerase sigma factor [Gemmatimonadota bacterium]
MDPSGQYHVNDGDALLVTRVLGGDENAYGVLMARYRDRFARYAFRLLGDQGDAEDVLQETFIRGYRFLSQCESPEKFGAWLFRILVNRCHSAYSGRGRKEENLGSSTVADTRPARGYGNDEAWREEIERALEYLPLEQREAFLLKYVEDLSYEEMEELTGMGISALKMRVKRACERLRELLGEVYDARS